jgi:lysophospholipase L1-like esterase
MLATAFGAAEMYLRFANKFPRSMIALPHRFVPEIGFLYKPGAEIRWTNGLDFWTTQRANSLGFADREPAIPKPASTFRILLIGDSFVEALQVPTEQKLQSLLGNALRRQFPERKYDVVAMGYAGTGQANQLPFIERYNETIKADLVVLLFVNNDFANNSPVLESVRRGWHPDYPPLLFEISSEYRHRQLPGATEAGRVKVLRSLSPEYRRKLEGWDPEKDPMDSVFFSEGTLPPVFEEAVELTRCAFAAWKRRAEQDGFQLIVLATDNVTKGPGMRNPKYGQIYRLQMIAQELHLPLLDLYPIFLNRGGPELARWKHDAHWNPTGHRWASEALIDFLNRGRYLGASGTARATIRRPRN